MPPICVKNSAVIFPLHLPPYMAGTVYPKNTWVGTASLCSAMPAESNTWSPSGCRYSQAGKPQAPASQLFVTIPGDMVILPGTRMTERLMTWLMTHVPRLIMRKPFHVPAKLYGLRFGLDVWLPPLPSAGAMTERHWPCGSQFTRPENISAPRFGRSEE